MTTIKIDPVELRALIDGLEATITDLPEDGHVVMTAGSARSLHAAALMWLRTIAYEHAPSPPPPPRRSR